MEEVGEKRGITFTKEVAKEMEKNDVHQGSCTGEWEGVNMYLNTVLVKEVIS